MKLFHTEIILYTIITTVIIFNINSQGTLIKYMQTYLHRSEIKIITMIIIYGTELFTHQNYSLKQ